jgi:hypothetical protein
MTGSAHPPYARKRSHNEIFEVFSYRSRVSRIVVMRNKALIPGSPCRKKKILHAARHRRLIDRDRLRRFSGGKNIGIMPRRRKLNKPLPVEGEQKAPAHIILQGSVGLSPVPFPAKILRNAVPAQITTILHKGTYSFDIIRRIIPSPVSDCLHREGISQVQLERKHVYPVTEGLPATPLFCCFIFLKAVNVIFCEVTR